MPNKKPNQVRGRAFLFIFEANWTRRRFLTGRRQQEAVSELFKWRRRKRELTEITRKRRFRVERLPLTSLLFQAWFR